MIAKYELTDETNADGLRRIRALRDIPRWGVVAGDMGGWVGGEHNLAQSGDAWVYGDARVSGYARVYGAAQVSGDALIRCASHCLSISGPITPNATNATLHRTKTGGHVLRVGCWNGTADDLHALADSDDWPSGQDAAYRDTWRPALHALAAYAAAHAATWGEQ